jgi:hypothetical protein
MLANLQTVEWPIEDQGGVGAFLGCPGSIRKIGFRR